MPIAEFEGILEPLGRMAGKSYIISSSVSTTAMAIGAGEKPSVISGFICSSADPTIEKSNSLFLIHFKAKSKL